MTTAMGNIDGSLVVVVFTLHRFWCCLLPQTIVDLSVDLSVNTVSVAWLKIDVADCSDDCSEILWLCLSMAQTKYGLNVMRVYNNNLIHVTATITATTMYNRKIKNANIYSTTTKTAKTTTIRAAFLTQKSRKFKWK